MHLYFCKLKENTKKKKHSRYHVTLSEKGDQSNKTKSFAFSAL
jgi:hypothetical protein